MNIELLDRFFGYYYDPRRDRFPRTWRCKSWLGHPIAKFTTDLWIYQKLIYEVKPKWIIETGTGQGGSALYFATILELVGHGKVVSVDINELTLPKHKIFKDRVVTIIGSSTSDETINKVENIIDGTVMVVLDSDHEKAHVARELSLYSSYVSVGSFIVVEDTIINGHPVMPDFGPGPYEAVEEFLVRNKNFDKYFEKDLDFLLTSFRDGILRRKQ